MPVSCTKLTWNTWLVPSSKQTVSVHQHCSLLFVISVRCCPSALSFFYYCVFFFDSCFLGVLYPDSVVGTDSHTPMVNGLGVYVSLSLLVFSVFVFPCFVGVSLQL